MKNRRERILKISFIVFTIAMLINIGNYVRADFIGDAKNWYTKDPGSTKIYNFGGGAFGQIVTVVNQIGTAVISITAVILGIKYMVGTARGKSEVKDQMISLLVACLLFFGWSNISSLLIKDATFNPTTGSYENVSTATQLFIFKDATNVASMAAKVFGIVVLVGKIVAIVVTMYLGAKYILSGANGKAELKEKGPMFIIGILLIFCTLNVLSFISDMVLDATNPSQVTSAIQIIKNIICC